MLNLIAPALVEPVSLAEAKTWLRVTHTDEDTLIAGLIGTARERIEHHTALGLITQSWSETLDDWPLTRVTNGLTALELARGPLIRVDAVRMLNRDGGVTVWDNSEYRIEVGRQGRLIAIGAHRLPAVQRPVGGIEINFTIGFGPSGEDVPLALREAILRLVSKAYSSVENAESAQRGSGGMPPDVADLIAPYRRVSL